MGIGMALVIRPEDMASVCTYLRRNKIKHYIIGEVINDSKRKIII